MTDSARDQTWLAGGWMQTYTGKAFYPLDPDPDLIDPADIAHALSLICRYGGHTRRFYSVAEHCVLMADAAEPGHKLWALLHDATEAYVGDMVRPLKRQMPAYVEAEDRLMAAICERFAIDPVCPPEVKTLDNRILGTERAALLGPPPRQWLEVEVLDPLPVTVTGWAPRRAEAEYLKALRRLGSF